MMECHFGCCLCLCMSCVFLGICCCCRSKIKGMNLYAWCVQVDSLKRPGKSPVILYHFVNSTSMSRRDSKNIKKQTKEVDRSIDRVKRETTRQLFSNLQPATIRF